MHTARRYLTPLAALVVLLMWSVAGHAQSRRPMTLIDLIEIPRLADAQLSPDGSQVLFTQDQPDWKANKRVPHVWRIGADGQRMMQLTYGDSGRDEPALVARREDDRVPLQARATRRRRRSS